MSTSRLKLQRFLDASSDSHGSGGIEENDTSASHITDVPYTAEHVTVTTTETTSPLKKQTSHKLPNMSRIPGTEGAKLTTKCSTNLLEDANFKTNCGTNIL